MSTTRSNALGQPIGEPLQGWSPPPSLPRSSMTGRYCRLEMLDVNVHGEDLWLVVSLDDDGRNWTYLGYGPFASKGDYLQWLAGAAASEDPLFHAIIDGASGNAVGVASFLRIDPVNGSIEVGHIHYSPALQRTRAATEAMYLMMKRVFELGYRRYEWKCDSLNGPSRAAARRYGFSYEGIFRQATSYKGRNRDTAWYAAIDREWPALEAAYVTWLDPENFDPQGRQRRSLSALTASILVSSG